MTRDIRDLLKILLLATDLVSSVDVETVSVHHSGVTPAPLGGGHASGGLVLAPRVLLDVKHPERGLLVIAEAELAPEHVEDVLVLYHGVALETARTRALATHPLPDIGVCSRVLSYHYHTAECYHYHSGHISLTITFQTPKI